MLEWIAGRSEGIMLEWIAGRIADIMDEWISVLVADVTVKGSPVQYFIGNVPDFVSSFQ